MFAWQQDPFRWEDDAEVVACAPARGGFEVLTTPTILFPEGGGQPADHGFIGDAPVVDVRKVDGRVVHLTTAPVPLGPARVRVDGTRRFDHMQQHTGQHLLTAVLLDRFGVGTTSFHLGPTHTAIELDVATLPEATLREAEALVNARIREALPVTSEEIEPGDLAARGVRSRGLPEGFDGRVRLVGIEGVDLNTCGGTHVRHTGELQLCALTRVDGVGARGCRLYFLVGGRARAALQEALAREAALTRLLSAPGPDHQRLVEAALEHRREADHRAARLDEQRGEEVAAALVAREEAVSVATLPLASARTLQVVASRVLAARPDRVVLLGAPEERSAGGGLVIAGPEDLVPAAAALVVPLVGGRGGGRGRWQGRATDLGRLAEAAALVAAACQRPG